MKPLFPIWCLSAIVWLQGCGGMIKHDADATAQVAPVVAVKIPVPAATANTTIKDEKDLTGYWVGAFRKIAGYRRRLNISMRASVYDFSDKINLSIDTINGDHVSGHTIRAGIFRPFRGTVEQTGNRYKFAVIEPGDDGRNGTFSFSISAGDSVLTGTWQASHNVPTPVRYYDLNKEFFKYNPAENYVGDRFEDTAKKEREVYKDKDGKQQVWDKYAMSQVDFSNYNASARLLSAIDLANLKAADLLIIRNAIYARHGYSFKGPALQHFFDKDYWYIPVSTDVADSLTAIEKQNIALLLRYEKNAKEYYDTFGR